MSREAGAAYHAQALQDKNPSIFTQADLIYVLGQSNAAQTTPAPNPSGFTCTDDIAWGIMRKPKGDMSLSGPFSSGNTVTPGYGQANGWVKWAQEWYDQTGRKSLWCELAVAGQQLCAISDPSATYQFSVSDMSKSLVGDTTISGDDFTRRQLLNHAIQSTTYNPRFSLGLRCVIWVQGEQDANLNKASLESAYQSELDAMFTFLKSELSIDYFFIVELGRKGTTTEEVATNEAAYQKVRNAQNAVAASRSDTFVVFNGCKQEGSPFNTLTVDGSGYWTSGWEYQADGVHYTVASNYALGKTSAKNALTAIGLI